MPFKALGLSAELNHLLTQKGYTKPTTIQERAIPLIVEGKDVMASSQTGTGKTAAFTLPIVNRLSMHTKNRPVIRALILTPTRELAAQIKESVHSYSRHSSLKSLAVFGGVNIFSQIKNLRSGVDVLIATPGRLLDHISQGTLDLSKVEIFVLDEADRMLDMGFIPDIRKILSFLPKKRQNLLFSATLSHEIKKLADGILVEPEIIEISDSQNKAADLVSQVIYPVDKKRKKELLSFLIQSENWSQVLVFTRTRHGADRLSEQLRNDKISAAAIHGQKSQAARLKALHDFKKGSVKVLVATDVAARGLHIHLLPYVVNFEMPECPEDYIHRIGRTGRAGNEGQAISFVCVDEHRLVRDIEYLLKRQIEVKILSGFEPDPSIQAEPIRKPRGSFRGNSRGPARGPSGRRPSGRGPSRPPQGGRGGPHGFKRRPKKEKGS